MLWGRETGMSHGCTRMDKQNRTEQEDQNTKSRSHEGPRRGNRRCEENFAGLTRVYDDLGRRKRVLEVRQFPLRRAWRAL